MKQRKPISPRRRSGLSDSSSSDVEDKKEDDKGPTVTVLSSRSMTEDDKAPTVTGLSSRCVTPTGEDSTPAGVAKTEVVPSSLSPSPRASPRKHKASEPLEGKEAKHVKFADDAKPEEID